MQITGVLLSDITMKPRKQGRPNTVGKTGEPRKVSLLLTPTQFKKIQARAKREGITVSELLRQAAA
jgi:hypothetical protein